MRSVFCALLCFAGLLRWYTVQAQEEVVWLRPEPIYIVDGEGTVELPQVAADVEGNVHAFWFDQIPSQGSAIMYARWADGEWSSPLDILASPNSLIVPLQTQIDDAGRLHLLWKDPSCLRHVAVSIRESMSASKWTDQPDSCIAERAIDGGFTVDSRGIVHVAFSSVDDGRVYYAQLERLGKAPPAVVAVSSPMSEQRINRWVRLDIDEPRGILHVVWTETISSWPPTGLYHARSTDGGRTWGEPLQIDEELMEGLGRPGEYSQVNVSVDPDGWTHLLWNGIAGIGGRYHARSGDGGETWFPVLSVLDRGSVAGTSGFPSVVYDSNQNLQLITDNDEIVHFTWDGIRWSNQAVVSTNQTGTTEDAQVTIAGGNTLHVVYFDERTSIQHAIGHLDAPRIATQLIPTLPEQRMNASDQSDRSSTSSGSDRPRATIAVTSGVVSESVGSSAMLQQPKHFKSSADYLGILLGLLAAMIATIAGVLWVRRR